jgi:hypothetical protein
VGTFEAIVFILISIWMLWWILSRVFRGSAPPQETAARADTYAGGSGYASEQIDNVRNVDR